MLDFQFLYYQSHILEKSYRFMTKSIKQKTESTENRDSFQNVLKKKDLKY